MQKVHKIVLYMIALYHLGFALLSFFSERITLLIAKSAFGVVLDGSPQVMYLCKLLGIYGFIFGVFVMYVARNPAKYSGMIYAICALYVLRVLDRALFLPPVRYEFQITMIRIMIGCVLLALFGAAVFLTKPKASG